MAAPSGVDATVVAIPFYFGSMAAERRYLQQRAEREGPSAADYDRPDTAASLTMGVASLVAPLAAGALANRVTPGKGRWGRALVGTAVGTAMATTVADRLVDHDRPAVRRWARRVAQVGGPVAIATGGLALTTTWADRTRPDRQWARGGEQRDRGAGPAAWVAAIAGWDLVYYWNHRLMHEVRGLWAIHVVHHSSERYNLSTALRQPVADVLGCFVPYGALSRAGIRPGLVAQARGINLLYQFWIHTDAIRSIGAAEEVLNTPSHHRVHHGSNRRYLDRNHGSILIVWDRLFGTFQREEEPVVYGLTKNIDSYAPTVIATHEYRDIVRDIARSTSWRDRLSFVLRGPGWAYQRHAERAASGAERAG
jgi:sterol desaturase/sphingolipid hydroxylase (fatty acid hydroxylase superfamily)